MTAAQHTLTLALSYNPYDFISTILPVSPSTPHECSPFACLALSSVNTRMAFPPLFCTSVRGMTSIASATALNGQPSTPVTPLAFACSPTLMAISVAPPPGARIGLKYTLRATERASARLRSISLRISFEGPRRRIVHAFGSAQAVRNVKYLKKCQV